METAEDTAGLVPHTMFVRSSFDRRPSKDLTSVLPTKVVGVAYQVLSISDIDDNQNRFSVDVIVYYSWYDETLQRVYGGDVDWENVWQPHPIFFDNDLETNTIFSHFNLDEGHGRVTLVERYRGTFYQHLHLADFPFDRQTLTVTIGSKRSSVELRQDFESCLNKTDIFYVFVYPTRYVEDESRRSGIKEEFSMAEWHRLEPQSTFTTVRSVASNNVYPLLKLCLRVRRRSGYYVYNTAVTIFLMVIMSWSSFFVRAQELGMPQLVALDLEYRKSALPFPENKSTKTEKVMRLSYGDAFELPVDHKMTQYQSFKKKLLRGELRW